ncbi:MAG: Ig-like domain-containing protein [Saprospiraceae bacterium]|nr:Ig-like domain-containing protein [Saprospiraceae bacterium]
MMFLRSFALLIVVSAIFIIGCKKDDFVEIDGVCPIVVSTIPLNGATNVPINQVISVTFNEEMNSATINQATFTIMDGASVQGVISYLGATATFTPTSPLIPNTSYTGRVSTAVKDKTGNALQADYVWTFSTGAILSPLVISTDPANNESNVNLNKIVTATFNMPMDALTLNSSTFFISLAGNKITGQVTYSGTTASFTPTADLKSNTTYTGTVTTGAKNPDGLSLAADYIWTFTTGTFTAPMVISTDPTNNAVDVGLNKIVTATFSEPMDPSSINESTFTLRQGVTILKGTVSYSGSTASFTPDEPFTAGTLYTGTISKSVKNPSGTTLTNDYIWTFTTESGNTPIVISTDPADNEVDVALNKTISATFSEVMDPLSINSTTFTLTQGANAIAGAISYSGTTAFFNPILNLLPGTTYTATITTGAKNLAGTPLANNYIWTFTTGTLLAPTVIFTDPANNATGVSLDKIITATFSVPMDPSTINGTTFILKNGTTSVSGTVTYSGSTASFNPSSNLLSGTTYTATITNGAKNLAGTPLAADYTWTFSTGAVIAPIVISTDPADNATGVNLNKTISATFSVPMDPLTINGSTFTLKNGTTSVSGTVSYTGTTASFNPTINLLPGTVYTATITTGAKNLAGIPLAENYVWSFTTAAAVAPTVISTDPVNNGTNVSLDKTISATFSEPMDPSTINASTFTLRNGTTSVTGTVSYTGTTAFFNPTTNLQPGTVYTATITTGAKNLAGTPLAGDYVWTFTTVSDIAPTVISTDPVNNATNVSPDKTISATFSVPMDPSTINGSTFTLKLGTATVSGTVTYSGTTAFLNPTTNLQPGTEYTATITTGAKNLAGTPLAANYIWTFTTSAATAPTVTSTDPLNNATGVSLNKTITATFSVPMDPSTINGTTFTLKNGTTSISGTVTYSGTTASFNPTENLLSGNTYTATITTGAKDVQGTPLSNNYVWTFSTVDPAGGPFVDLGTVARFGIIAGVGVSNNAGFSEIRNMDVGISPGVRSSITGFPPAIIVNGDIYASDDVSPPGVAAMLIQAKQDLTDAYNFAAGATTPAPVTVSGDLGGTTLAPGIYKTTSTLLIQSGDLTLDAQGDVNAVWIFQIASGFTTIGGAGGNVILSGGAQAKNVFWQTGSSATIGDFTSFYGNILALTSVTMNSGATAVGRMLCINGAVVMTNTNIINKP